MSVLPRRFAPAAIGTPYKAVGFVLALVSRTVPGCWATPVSAQGYVPASSAVDLLIEFHPTETSVDELEARFWIPDFVRPGASTMGTGRNDFLYFADLRARLYEQLWYSLLLGADEHINRTGEAATDALLSTARASQLASTLPEVMRATAQSGVANNALQAVAIELRVAAALLEIGAISDEAETEAIVLHGVLAGLQEAKIQAVRSLAVAASNSPTSDPAMVAGFLSATKRIEQQRAQERAELVAWARRHAARDAAGHELFDIAVGGLVGHGVAVLLGTGLATTAVGAALPSALLLGLESRGERLETEAAIVLLTSVYKGVLEHRLDAVRSLDRTTSLLIEQVRRMLSDVLVAQAGRYAEICCQRGFLVEAALTDPDRQVLEWVGAAPHYAPEDPNRLTTELRSAFSLRAGAPNPGATIQEAMLNAGRRTIVFESPTDLPPSAFSIRSLLGAVHYRLPPMSLDGRSNTVVLRLSLLPDFPRGAVERLGSFELQTTKFREGGYGGSQYVFFEGRAGPYELAVWLMGSAGAALGRRTEAYTPAWHVVLRIGGRIYDAFGHWDSVTLLDGERALESWIPFGQVIDRGKYVEGSNFLEDEVATFRRFGYVVRLPPRSFDRNVFAHELISLDVSEDCFLDFTRPEYRPVGRRAADTVHYRVPLHYLERDSITTALFDPGYPVSPRDIWHLRAKTAQGWPVVYANGQRLPGMEFLFETRLQAESTARALRSLIESCAPREQSVTVRVVN